MPVFVIVAEANERTLSERIRETFPEAARYRLTTNAWLVDYEGTTRALSEALGMRSASPDRITAIAFPISNWSGFFTNDVWEWLKLHGTRGEN